MSRIITFARMNPAAILFSVNALAALAVSWGVPVTPAQAAGITAGITAVITILTAVATRPVGLQVVLGGSAALVTALAPFGLHLTAQQEGAGAMVLSLALAAVLHLAHVPVTAARQGTTAAALALAGERPAPAA